MPCGAKSPLCPVKARASMCISCMLTGTTPALCALSTINFRLCLWQKLPIAAKGCSVPQTLLACVMMIALVLGRTSCGKASKHSAPSASQGMRLKVIASVGALPAVSSVPICWSGRMTALCSIALTSTWSPLCSSPLMMIFRLSVMFFVKTTFLLSSLPKKRQSCSRVAKTRSSVVVAQVPRLMLVPACVIY